MNKKINIMLVIGICFILVGIPSISADKLERQVKDESTLAASGYDAEITVRLTYKNTHSVDIEISGIPGRITKKVGDTVRFHIIIIKDLGVDPLMNTKYMLNWNVKLTCHFGSGEWSGSVVTYKTDSGSQNSQVEIEDYVVPLTSDGPDGRQYAIDASISHEILKWDGTRWNQDYTKFGSHQETEFGDIVFKRVKNIQRFNFFESPMFQRLIERMPVLANLL